MYKRENSCVPYKIEKHVKILIIVVGHGDVLFKVKESSTLSHPKGSELKLQDSRLKILNIFFIIGKLKVTKRYRKTLLLEGNVGMVHLFQQGFTDGTMRITKDRVKGVE